MNDSYRKSYVYIKGYATGKSLQNTLRALHFAENAHYNQYRKGGDPYIVHPLRVTSELVANGIDEDIILAAALLHDVVEDCEVTEYDFIQYGITSDVFDIVSVLTKSKEFSTSLYYQKIQENPRAAIIKLADRCHNVSTLEAFTIEKIKKYIQETKDYVYPLCRYVRNVYPEYSNAVFLMKYHIRSVCELAEHFINIIEDESNGTQE